MIMLAGEVAQTICIFTVIVSWGWTRRKLLELLPRRLAATSDFELLHLMFAKSSSEAAVVWLLGNYAEKVDLEVRRRGRLLKVEVLKGWLRVRVSEDCKSKRKIPSLKNNTI